MVIVDITRVRIHLQVYNYNRYECGKFAGVQSLSGNEHMSYYSMNKLNFQCSTLP